MNLSIEFNHECSSMTIKVSDKAPNDLLAAEMPAVESVGAQ